MIEPCIVLTVLGILGFAIFGFIVAVMKIAGHVPRRETTDPHIYQSCLLLNLLRRSGRITHSQYVQLRVEVERHYPYIGGLPERIPETWTVVTAIDEDTDEDISAVAVTVDDQDSELVILSPIAVAPTADRQDDAVEQVPVEHAAVAAAIQPLRPRTESRAPWDIPDEPPKPPARPLSELLAGFMQDKNIRWGELASGILIVGSAVGLVISLREELRRTIPFFPALVFLLITAAIHAVGIYTLRRWKLRNTSRGALVIGLLLVPLNFLAACVLTGQGADRREITDPVYWIAITIGVSAFTTMTWISSKHLFRRGHWPAVAAILICSLTQLINNRITLPIGSSWRMMLLTVPILIGFLAGVVYTVPNQWMRTRWSDRTISRIFILLGLSAFSFAAAIAVVFSRSPNWLETAIALMPAFCVVLTMVGWIGVLVAANVPSQKDGPERETATNLRLAGTTLAVLGLVLTLACVVSSIVNPTVLLASSLVSGGLLCGLAVNRRLPAIMTGVWACLGVAALTGLNLALGNFQVDRWTTPAQMRDATVSGSAGLCLGAVGFLIIAGAALLNRIGMFDKSDRKQQLIHYASAAAMFGLGCLLALIASFINPHDPFDVTTATVLLMLIAVLAFVASFQIAHRALPFVATLMLAGALLHGLFWNTALAEFVLRASQGIDIRWSRLTVLTTTGCALAALVARLFRRKISTAPLLPFAICGTIAIGGAVISGLFLMPHASGWATRTMLLTAFTAVAIAGATRRRDSAIVFFTTTVFATVAAVGEAALHFDWCASLADSRHIWLQIMALGVWCVIGLGLAFVLRGKKWCYWLNRHTGHVERAVLYGLAIAVTFLIAIGLSLDVGAELSRDIVNRPDIHVRLLDNFNFVAAALATVALATAFSLIVRPRSLNIAVLIVFAYLVSGLIALSCESARGVGSALRWLLPISGLGVAGLIGARGQFANHWNSLRRRLRLRERGDISQLEWQRLINLSLAIVVTIVLLISTLAIGQVMLHGGAALGGPLTPSWFGGLRKDVSYGVPIAIIVSTFLFHAIAERRGWLAIIGSAVFQYVVLVSLVLLCISPHPKLATEWFLNILQAVSLGMSLYGFVWFAYLHRIGSSRLWRDSSIRQLDLHAIINVVLVGSLSVLIIQQLFLRPDVSMGWISEAAGPLGYLSLAIVVALAIKIWPEALRSGLIWFTGLAGVAGVSLIAATVDRFSSPGSWWPLHVMLIGSVATLLAQSWFALTQHRHRQPSARDQRFEFGDWSMGSLPTLLLGFLVTMFAIRGGWSADPEFWLYFVVMLALVGVALVHGFVLMSWRASFVAAAVALIAAQMLVFASPWDWFHQPISSFFHTSVLSLLLVSLIWLGFYIYQKRGRRIQLPRTFVRLPNSVALMTAIWIVFSSLIEWLLASGWGANRGDYFLATPLGCLVIAGAFALLVLQAWNDRARFRIVNLYLWTIGVVVLGVVVFVSTRPERPIVMALAWGLLTAIWAQIWRRRKLLRYIGKRLHMPRLAATHRTLQQQVPRIHLIIGGIVLMISIPAIFVIEPRWLRYLSAQSVVPLSLGFGPFADERRRWIQWASLSMLTLACVMLAWADLPLELIHRDVLSLPVRTFLVLAAAVFGYGVLLPRVIKPGNIWIPIIRQATVATSVLSLLFFTVVLIREALVFMPLIGCGLPVATSIAVAVMAIGMIAGLICIAVLPQLDPLALSLDQRMGYVYTAEAVAAGLVAHLYLSMPLLFQFGLKQFWPYVAMLLSFGGVALANLLAHRKLRVLEQPFFHTAAVLPIMAAVAYRAIDSKADASVVMLLAGAVYLMISLTRASLVSGAAAVVFGNLALWLFYHKYPAFEFLKHPQLWLIPPAISVLVAGQLQRDRLTKSQLTTLRYLSVAVIYISSTSEIFISGLGERLWPPMVLALLAVGGMMIGIVMQVRAYLFLGALFLLLAMITMVAHAQQRLHHVWPWWAFGIVLGISILVFFGLFEKRRAEMTKLARQLSDWDY